MDFHVPPMQVKVCSGGILYFGDQKTGLTADSVKVS